MKYILSKLTDLRDFSLNWVGISALIVALQYLAAALVGHGLDFRYGPSTRRILEGVAVYSTFAILGFALIRIAYFAATREPNPLPRFWSDVLRSRYVPAAFFLVSAQWAVLSWLKLLMPHKVGFWADPPLAELDALILGQDAWRLVAWIPGGRPMDLIYSYWSVVIAGTFAALTFAPENIKRGRAMVAYFLVIGLSAFSQYLLPSAGPIFYEAAGHGNRFANLPVAPMTQDVADYLLQNYLASGTKFGTGISAMPSVHVGLAAWVALCVATYFPKLKVLGWAYFSVILFGSVYLGWHYLVDGVAGLAIAIAAWRFAPWLLNYRAVRHSSAMSQQAVG